MTQLSLFLDLPRLSIDHIEISGEVITNSLHSEAAEAKCPLCAQGALRIQSPYTRTLQDLSVREKTLRLLLQVRRFFCDNVSCMRKVFAERFSDLTNVCLRPINRLTTILSTLGFTLGGKTPAQIGHTLGISSSRDTCG